MEERLTVVANKHQTVAGSSPATQIMLHREANRPYSEIVSHLTLPSEIIGAEPIADTSDGLGAIV